MDEIPYLRWERAVKMLEEEMKRMIRVTTLAQAELEKARAVERDAKAELERVEAELKRAEEAVKRDRAEVATLQARVSALELEVATAQSALEEAERETQRLGQKRALIEAELQSVGDRIREGFLKEDGVQQQKEELEGKIDDVKDKINEIQREAAQLEEVQRDLALKLKNSREQVAKCTAEQAELQLRLEDLEIEAVDIMQSIETHGREEQRLGEEQEAALRGAEAAEQQMRNAEKELAQLQESHSVGEFVTDIVGVFMPILGKISKLVIGTYRAAQIQSLLSQIEQHRQTAQGFHKRAGDLQRYRQAAATELERERLRKRGSDTQLRDVEGSRKKVQQQLQSAIAGVQALERSAGETKTKLETAESTRRRHLTDQRSYQTRLGSLTRQKEALQQQNNHLQTEYAKQDANYQASKRAIEDHKLRVATAQRTLVAAHTDVEGALQKVNEARTAVKARLEEQHDSARKLSDAKAKARARENRVAQVNAELALITTRHKAAVEDKRFQLEAEQQYERRATMVPQTAQPAVSVEAQRAEVPLRRA
ncbi:hypothetical protein M427DRAFT_138673 [Gonapodya prolifera JEL478]|uniref:Uncharacterized protein n=1 Tax=Gonapodya prolifera (strain JEL478) TaxID=1344416 RepID=A0A139A2N7_GONPJ|nr:hypothetical protein M427DRAFT_138673 [Gonapodya prolifera JEL478]|eukprot:KXS11011.1 hypothetical protein M427DRAFT_138673 [Gonapodya prolifera JEL478]